MNSYFYIEGHIYLKNEIPITLINKQYFEPYNSEEQLKLKITGLCIFDDSIFFFLPKNTQDIIPDKFKKKLGKLTFKSLLKYRNENRLRSKEKYWLGKENSNAELVDTIKWLIKDYKNNGIYLEEIRNESNDINDRIQWNRTIKNQNPYIIKDQIFYPDLITVNRKINPDSLLTAIHNNIINEITNLYGWLFQVNIRKDYKEINLPTNQVIQLLKKKLYNTSNSRNQMLIINIIQYLVNFELKNKTFDLVTPYFEYVWEDALSQIFGDEEELYKIVAKPYWKFNDGTIKVSNQIPDVLVSLNSKLFIIDAKYYSLNENNKVNLPGWDSVVKQLYYNLSLKVDDKEIENLFLIPDLSLNKNLFTHIGLTSVDNFEEIFGVVNAFKVNTEFVLSSYIEKKNRKELLLELL